MAAEKIYETDVDLAKNNFLARMSHEMRTPLNAILGMSTIAQSSHDLEAIAACLKKINEASMHLLGMINDILDIAKIETGKLKLVNTEFNLAKILRKTAESIKFSLDAKKQNLVLDIDPLLPETVIGDGQKLTQVVFNLLSNAGKFTPPEGTITLQAKKLKEENETCTIEIKVSDTGIGISPESLKRIFIPFEQLDGNLDRRFEGAGVGLTLCQNVIHLFGGNIQVESEKGKGSCFSFVISLKQKKKDAMDSSPIEDLSPAEITKQPKFNGLSILLAEDVEINREIILSYLEGTGINADCATNGKEALDMYKASPDKYGLIFMDIHMPEMDGLESSRQIRAFELGIKENPRKQIPIIAMTANVFKDDIEKCLSVGMTSHLGKPIDYDEFMKQIYKFFA